LRKTCETTAPIGGYREKKMSLFGEKCARCGVRTKEELKGSPVCERCQHEMQLMVEAQSENPRKCPIDGATMQKEISFLIVIDRCPTCSGVWLDGGELERISSDVEEKALIAMSRSFVMPMV
jgi:hypothetical protein